MKRILIKDKSKNSNSKKLYFCPLCKYKTKAFDNFDIHLHSDGHISQEKKKIRSKTLSNSRWLAKLEKVNGCSFEYLREERLEDEGFGAKTKKKKEIKREKRKRDEDGDEVEEGEISRKKRRIEKVPRYDYHFDAGILGDDGWESEVDVEMSVGDNNVQTILPVIDDLDSEKKQYTQFNFFEGADFEDVPGFIPLDRSDMIPDLTPQGPMYGEIDGRKYTKPDLIKPVWQTSNYAKGIDGLHDEIIDFMEYMQPTEAEAHMREYVLDKVVNATKELWPGCSIECFGSYACDLYLPTSDIDIAVWDIPGESPDILYDLANKLEAKGVAESYDIEVITNAKVPVLKLKERVTKTQVDIVMNIQNGRLNTQTIENILSTYPAAKPLIIFIKYFLYLRNLNEPYSGGFGSYSVVLLMTSFLQMHGQVANDDTDDQDDLGLLLLGFLRLYGQDFNFYLLGISVREGGYFLKKTKGWMEYGRPHLPAIEDPNDPNNNVGASSRAISFILQAFRSSYQKLSTQPNRAYVYSETLLSRVIYIDAEFPQRRNQIETMYKNGDF